jgi:hypothetical protein
MAVVFFSATEAVVWHTHDSAPVDRCPICHLGHLPAIAPTAGATLPCPAPIHFAAAAPQIVHYDSEVSRSFSSRAPPALS